MLQWCFKIKTLTQFDKIHQFEAQTASTCINDPVEAKKRVGSLNISAFSLPPWMVSSSCHLVRCAFLSCVKQQTCPENQLNSSVTGIMGNWNASVAVAQCKGGLRGNCPTLEATALSKGYVRPESGPTALKMYNALPTTTLTIRQQIYA